MLIVLAGLPGAGKTTIACELARRSIDESVAAILSAVAKRRGRVESL